MEVVEGRKAGRTDAMFFLYIVATNNNCRIYKDKPLSIFYFWSSLMVGKMSERKVNNTAKSTNWTSFRKREMINNVQRENNSVAIPERSMILNRSRSFGILWNSNLVSPSLLIVHSINSNLNKTPLFTFKWSGRRL